MTVTEFLQSNVPFLKGLSDEEAHTLAQGAEQAQFKPGHMIIMQGTTVEGLHVIAEGTVAVWIKPKDKTSVKVATLGPGQVFGERSILEFGVAGATIKAVDEVLVFVIPQAAFLTLMESNPALKEYFMKQIEDRRKPLASNPKPEAPPSPPTPPPAA